MLFVAKGAENSDAGEVHLKNQASRSSLIVAILSGEGSLMRFRKQGTSSDCATMAHCRWSLGENEEIMSAVRGGGLSLVKGRP